MTEYEKRALDPCWQHKQTCVALFTLDSHNTSYLYRREDGSYYWQHLSKGGGRRHLTLDADELQLELFGSPHLSKEFIMKSILSV